MKTIEEMIKDWYAHVGENTDIDLYRREIADYWLSVITQDRVERDEKIFKSISDFIRSHATATSYKDGKKIIYASFTADGLDSLLPDRDEALLSNRDNK